MSNNIRRLYLNSLDTSIIYDVNSKATFDIGKGDYHSTNNKRLKMSLIRCEIPSTTGLVSLNDSDLPNENNFVFNFEIKLTDTPEYTPFTIIFNTEIDTSKPSFNLTLQTTINDFIYFVNTTVGTDILGIAPQATDIGLQRLVCLEDYQVIKFGSSTPSLLRALGVNEGTVINDNSMTPYNFSMSEILPNIIVRTNLNFESYSSNTENLNQTNIMDCIPCVLSQGTQFEELKATYTITGSTVNNTTYRNTASLVYNGNNEGRDIGNTSINTLTIELLSPEFKPLSLGQNKFSMVIQIETVE